MKPSSVRWHHAVAGLVALVTDTVPDGVTVLDGPRRREEVGLELVTIGWDRDENTHLSEQRVNQEYNLSGRATAEGDIACRISIIRGDGDMAATRDRAVEVLELIEHAIRADWTRLAGAVDDAEIGASITAAQAQTNDGASVALSFTVSYTAYI